MQIIPDTTWALLTIFMEAEGESHEGKTAVAEVILRRTLHKYQSDGTVAGTCLKAFQFSCWNTNSPSRVRAAKLTLNSDMGRECAQAWDRAIGGSNITNGAVLYLNPLGVLAMPEWAIEKHKVAQVGRHHFYTDRVPVIVA